MKKKILILQMRPEDETAESELVAIAKTAKIDLDTVERVRIEQRPDFKPDLSKYKGIIAGGSPFDISTPENLKTDSQKYVENFFNNLFDEIVPKDFPFLGACSGNGLLGNYLGAKISKKYPEPVGHVRVSLTEKGLKDQLLLGMNDSFTALVGHKEACEQTPNKATLLITSTPCPVQMFRVGENIYACQFHPEADEAEFALRIDTYKNFGYFDPSEAQKLKDNLIGVQTPETQEILKRFARLCESLG